MLIHTANKFERKNLYTWSRWRVESKNSIFEVYQVVPDTQIQIAYTHILFIELYEHTLTRWAEVQYLGE